MYKVVKTIQLHLKMASVTDVHYIQHAVIEFLVAEKKSGKHPQTSLQCLWKCHS
jgi:hypothetical protein